VQTALDLKVGTWVRAARPLRTGYYRCLSIGLSRRIRHRKCIARSPCAHGHPSIQHGVGGIEDCARFLEAKLLVWQDRELVAQRVEAMFPFDLPGVDPLLGQASTLMPPMWSIS
jgi:hypothetical protein